MAITRKEIQLHDVDSHIGTPSVSGYCPISVKNEINPPDVNYLDNMSNADIFLSKKNMMYMIYYLIAMNNKNMTGNNTSNFHTLVPQMMKDWAEHQRLNDFEYVYDNIILRLKFLNEKFLVNHANVYDKANLSSLNVFRVKDKVTVDACGNQALKKYNEMSADDYKNIDVWQSEQLYTYDKRNRYGNKFPVWQYSMNTRHYDLSNDGLHTSNPDRASLNNISRGYNMENIIKGSDFYNYPSYENL